MAQLTIAAMRFGFGLPLPEGAPIWPAAMLESLAGPDHAAAAWPLPAATEVAAAINAYDTAQKTLKAEGASAKPRLKAAAARIDDQFIDAARAMIARALSSPDGFRERLVLFWADHFTVVAKGRRLRAMPAQLVEQAIRPHVAGRLADMLVAVTTHPAMLTYLNQDRSFGPGSRAGLRQGKGLNENLAREVLELHTLGVGAGYGQADVRELAELLTGLGVDGAQRFAFYPERAEPGAEQVLGQTYGGAGRADMAPVLAALHDIAQRPETAQHIARKLALHFLSDAPDAAAVARIAQAFMAGKGDLSRVYAALLAEPAALAPPGAKVRPPVEFLVAGLRALGVTAAQLMALDHRSFRRLVLEPLRAMGQPWQAPRGPDGWPEAAADWITPQGLAARLDWAMTAPADLVQPLPDPRPLVARVLGDGADVRLVWAAERAESLADGVGLILASPDFNRR